jgi:hypothetical protein
MSNSVFGSPTPNAMSIPAAFFGGVGLMAAGLCLACTTGWPVSSSAAVIGLSAVLAVSWLLRYRAAKRWQAVLDAYAETEIAQARPRKQRWIP